MNLQNTSVAKSGLPRCDTIENGEELMMMDMSTMGGMGWMMGAMGLIWLGIAVAVVLGIAALVKYLRRK